MKYPKLCWHEYVLIGEETEREKLLHAVRVTDFNLYRCVKCGKMTREALRERLLSHDGDRLTKAFGPSDP